MAMIALPALTLGDIATLILPVSPPVSCPDGRWITEIAIRNYPDY